jgi:hypothetical protein
VDQKPLRHEDYLAMEELVRKLQTENRRLLEKAREWDAKVRKVGKQELRGNAFSSRYLAPIVGMAIFILLAVFPTFLIFVCFSESKRKTVEHSNPSPCYFVRQGSLYGDAVQPWDPWYVLRSSAEGFDRSMSSRTNSYVYQESHPDDEPANFGYLRHHTSSGPVRFGTRDEAWRFITKWNLEACK